MGDNGAAAGGSSGSSSGSSSSGGRTPEEERLLALATSLLALLQAVETEAQEGKHRSVSLCAGGMGAESGLGLT